MEVIQQLVRKAGFSDWVAREAASKVRRSSAASTRGSGQSYNTGV